MKNAVICIVVFAMLCGCLCGCAPKHEDWQTIEISGCGTIKIPPEWQYFTEDDLLYILDENSKPIMIEYDWETEGLHSNKYYSDFEYLDTISSTGFSNSADYGEYMLIHEGQEKKFLFLSLPEPYFDFKDFIVWDESLSMDELEEIAKTFVIIQL